MFKASEPKNLSSRCKEFNSTDRIDQGFKGAYKRLNRAHWDSLKIVGAQNMLINKIVGA